MNLFRANSPHCCKTCRNLRSWDGVPACTPAGDLSAYQHRLLDYRCTAYVQDNLTPEGINQFTWLQIFYGE